ncbi:MAG: hypothetical protein LM587_03185 [Candidatus Aenigmarchaeota archaeon]|nr:hypothetical protein [Candidatus Aenigmarchaeota archaeon]
MFYGLYYKPSEFGNVMLSLLDNVDEKIITYMLLLQADYTTDSDLYNIDLLDDANQMICKNINKNLHHVIFYELSFKIKTLTYYEHKNSKLRLSPSLLIPIQNVILANLFANVVLINGYVRNFNAPILSYIALLM